MKKIYFIIFISIISLCSVSFAHPGRTDGYGGHYNRSTGTYHYHNGKYSGSYTKPVEEGGIPVNGTMVVWDNDDGTQSFITLDDDEEEIKQEDINIEAKEEKEDKSNMTLAYILLILLGIYIIYNVIKYWK